MRVLVTGIAGFIGFHLARRLVSSGIELIGVDNMNAYYDVTLKEKRLSLLLAEGAKQGNVPSVHRINLEDSENLYNIFRLYKPTIVVNLAAQAGVRHSLEAPMEYVSSNIVGFCNILEACKRYGISNCIYASSSSVYGGNTSLPFVESQTADHPMNMYAASKRANELMAHSYSSLYNISTVGLRFFTVYGPWGRPDMALFKFTKNILERSPIQVYNHGDMARDFTFIDDVVESIMRLIKRGACMPYSSFDRLSPDPSRSWAPFRIFNVGNSNPVKLLDYIEAIENATGLSAIKEYLPLQAGDVPVTASNSTELYDWIGYKPATSVKTGVHLFVRWYRDYFGV